MRLAASASAPSLPRDGGGYAHSERVERRVPLLALVPLDQLQQTRRREEEVEEDLAEDHERSQHKPVARRKRRDPKRKKDTDDEEGKHQLCREEQQRLGERFLGMMALLARLRRMDLEGSDSPTKKQPTQRSGRHSTPRVSARHQEHLHERASALEKLVEKKRTGGGGGSPVHPLSPHRRPDPVVNVATAPLREHLTFEISMLLPPPMDTRQSALHSPIQRQTRKKRVRKRRRRKRPTGAVRVDGKRTWQTSHVTWVPHASTDYAQARAAEGMATTAGSKLVAKFAALRTTAQPATSSQNTTLLVATDSREHARRRLPIARVRGEPRVEDDWEENGGEEEEPVYTVGAHTRAACGLIEEDAEDEEGEEEDDDGSDRQEDDHASEDAEDEEVEDEEDDEDDERQADVLPDFLPHAARPVLHRSAIPTGAPPPLARPVQTHQAAWISPELRTWLLHSGLFRTTSS